MIVLRSLGHQLRPGVLNALGLPVLATFTIERRDSPNGNSHVVLVVLLWMPLMIGAAIGAVRASLEDDRKTANQIRRERLSGPVLNKILSNAFCRGDVARLSVQVPQNP